MRGKLLEECESQDGSLVIEGFIMPGLLFCHNIPDSLIRRSETASCYNICSLNVISDVGNGKLPLFNSTSLHTPSLLQLNEVEVEGGGHPGVRRAVLTVDSLTESGESEWETDEFLPLS